ncbi:MAG: alpha/beta fold hydrolase [Pseudomonadota bacterium]
MGKQNWRVQGVGLGIFLILLTAAADLAAGPATRLAGVENLSGLKKYYVVNNFKIGGRYDLGGRAGFDYGGEGGATLESLGAGPLRLAYIALGTPQRDEKGKIVNAVIVNSYYAGDSSLSLFLWGAGRPGNGFAQGPVIGPGLLLDTNKYYVILLDALGLWGASKPSDGLGPNFPQYSLGDMVQANYRLLTDELGVSKIRLATGVSMGAMQCYLWALMHPEMVEAIMPIGGAIRENSGFKWLLELMTAALQSDPAWRETKGYYYDRPKEKHPNQGVMFGWSLLEQSSLSHEFRANQPWSAVAPKVFSWIPEAGRGTGLAARAAEYDLNDLIQRNRAFDGFDIARFLKDIKASTLIIHVKNDQWLPFSQAGEAARMIPGARLLGFESPLSHYGIFAAPNLFRKEIKGFLEERE